MLEFGQRKLGVALLERPQSAKNFHHFTHLNTGAARPRIGTTLPSA